MDPVEVERLIDEADERCVPVVAALVEMYGDGLARVVDTLPDDVVLQLAEDPVVSYLLVLHDLHPVSAENRVREAVAGIGVYAVVIGVEQGVVRLRAPADGRRELIEQAITTAAPDVDKVEFVDEALVVLPQVGG